jgi:multidrug efflux pump subunit AcrB
VLGVLPLLVGAGAGANSRFSIGLMIAVGMLVGTLFTLFVLPTLYLPFGRGEPPATVAPAGEESSAR